VESLWQSWGAVLVHVTMGIGLASCAGLRAFLPLFVVGLAGRLDLVTLSESFSWLESWAAIVVFGVAVVVEVLADKFPVVDNLLDSVQTFVKPIAGALVMATVVEDWTPLYATVFWIVMGGSSAGLVHITKAKLRLVSTATTAGVGNPVLSTSEDVGALAGTVGSIAVPPVMVIVLAVGVVLAWVVLRRFRRRAP
jgi:uncharacterized membrane protein